MPDPFDAPLLPGLEHHPGALIVDLAGYEGPLDLLLALARTHKLDLTQLSMRALAGQYLAFIHYYVKIHGRAPSEAEMQQYFRVSPPSVHQMILTLEAHRLITRTPGEARSIRLLIAREELPDLT